MGRPKHITFPIYRDIEAVARVLRQEPQQFILRNIMIAEKQIEEIVRRIEAGKADAKDASALARLLTMQGTLSYQHIQIERTRRKHGDRGPFEIDDTPFADDEREAADAMFGAFKEE